MIKKKYFIILILISFFITPVVYAHPGRTDTNGCHTCKTNCAEKWGLEYGEYHCHGTDSSVVKKAKAESKKTARTSSR